MARIGSIQPKRVASRCQALLLVFVRPERRETSAHRQAEKREAKLETERHAHEAPKALTPRSAHCSANGYALTIKGSHKTGRHGDCDAFVRETLIGSGG